QPTARVWFLPPLARDGKQLPRRRQLCLSVWTEENSVPWGSATDICISPIRRISPMCPIIRMGLIGRMGPMGQDLLKYPALLQMALTSWRPVPQLHYVVDTDRAVVSRSKSSWAPQTIPKTAPPPHVMAINAGQLW